MFYDSVRQLSRIKILLSKNTKVQVNAKNRMVLQPHMMTGDKKNAKKNSFKPSKNSGTEA